MEVTIAGITYPLYFGFGFLKEVNKLKSISMEGVPTGFGGMNLLSIGLAMQDPEAIEVVIKAGTATAKSKPSTEAIYGYIDQLAEEDKMDEFFDEVSEAIKKAPILQKAMTDGNQGKVQAGATV